MFKAKRLLWLALCMLAFASASLSAQDTTYQVQIATTTFVNKNLDADCSAEMIYLNLVQGDFDVDGDKRLSKTEVEMALNTAWNPRLGWITDRLDELFDKIDADHSGNISFTEFLVAAADTQAVLDQEHIKQAFEAFDKSHTGDITVDDLKKVFKDNGGNFWTCTSWNMKKKMKDADADHNGKISREEFEAMLADVHSSNRLNQAYRSWRGEKDDNNSPAADEEKRPPSIV